MQWITEPRIVEACKTLSIGAIKRDLKRARKKEVNITGQIRFKHGDDWKWTEWNYYIDYVGSETYLVVSIGNTNNHYEPNRILLTERALKFGTRSFFVCPHCDRIVGKLYLPQRWIVFWCRQCFRLKYRLQTLKKPTE